MKAKALAALIAIFLLGAAIMYGQLNVPQNIGPQEKADNENLAPFPDVAFRTLDGKTLRVKSLSEKTVLVHFWAAWCAPCQEEFPELLKYVAKSNGDVALLSVSLDDKYDDSQKALDRIAQKYGVDMRAPHLYWAWDQDRNLSLHTFNTAKVPETIIVDDKRRMADKIVGAGTWDR